jgi:hypothetical protein
VDAAAVLQQLQDLGITAQVTDRGTISLRPRPAPALLEDVRRHKGELLALLQGHSRPEPVRDAEDPAAADPTPTNPGPLRCGPVPGRVALLRERYVALQKQRAQEERTASWLALEGDTLAPEAIEDLVGES